MSARGAARVAAVAPDPADPGTGPARAGTGPARAGTGPARAGTGGAGTAPETAPARPLTITVAVIIEALEAVLVAVAAVLAAVAAGRGQSYQLSGGIAITVIGLATAVLLALVAAGLRQPRRWTRTPALLTQLFTGIVGIYLLQGGRYDWGSVALVLALAGLAVLLAPASTRALTVGLPQPADRHRQRPR